MPVVHSMPVQVPQQFESAPPVSSEASYNLVPENVAASITSESTIQTTCTHVLPTQEMPWQPTLHASNPHHFASEQSGAIQATPGQAWMSPISSTPELFDLTKDDEDMPETEFTQARGRSRPKSV